MPIITVTGDEAAAESNKLLRERDRHWEVLARLDRIIELLENLIRQNRR